MKILIGYDGSVDADGALHDLGRAGLPSKVEARVVSVTTPWKPFGPEGQLPMGFSPYYAEHRDNSLKEARILAERAAGYLRRSHPGWKVKAEAVLHEPANGLMEVSDRWKPDLIVLGSHGHSTLGRLLMGSVSQSVLHHAGVSVRITRPRLVSKGKGLRLMVAVDGSPGADAAVAEVARRTWPGKTEVRVAGVVDTRSGLGAFPSPESMAYHIELAAFRRDWIMKAVAMAAGKLSRAGLRAGSAVLNGDARSALEREAGDWGADCLFLGSRGLGAPGRLLLGSVSSSISAHVPCTVEVVRAKVRRSNRRTGK